MKRALILAWLGTAAIAASAQPLYRWTDEKGRVNITDTPPPGSATSVQTLRQQTPSAAPDAADPQQPYEVRHAMREFPVTLYTSPSCKEPCAAARALLNKRGVSFKEVQVWDEPSNEELKRVSGGDDVPTLVVGRSVHRGYAQGPYDALLDSARYPRAGLLPLRAQAAPPEGYGAEAKREAEPQAPAPSGPYAPRPPRN